MYSLLHMLEKIKNCPPTLLVYLFVYKMTCEHKVYDYDHQ